MNTIVLYYSKSENTKIVAETLSRELNTDILRINEVKEKNSFVNKISSSFNALMENKTDIKPRNVDLTEYDSVYIGTPTWAGKPTPAIITLIDRLDLRGKDIFLFTTMSSDNGRSAIERMEEKVKVRGGRVIETFIISTKNKTPQEIINDTEVTINTLDLKVYK